MYPAQKNQLLTIPVINWPWIDSPFFEELLEKSNLNAETKDLVKQFAEFGYLILDTELDDFDRLAERIITALAPVYAEQGKVKDAWIFNERIQDAWTFNKDVQTIATAPKILSLLKILYQREPIPFQTLNFPKGTEQTTHSDAIHFHSVPARFMCGVWVALEDVDANNGPLHYYPQSHKLPIFSLNDLGIRGSHQKDTYEFYPVYEKFLQDLIEQKQLKKVDLSLKKGQALIWAANLLHGGSPILDPQRTRHSQVTHYYFSECMYYTPLLSDPFLHRLHSKQIRNIITGEVVPQFYNGQEIQVEPGEYLVDRLHAQLDRMQTESEQWQAQYYQAQTESQQLRQQMEQWQTQLHHIQTESEQWRMQMYRSQEESEQWKTQMLRSQAECEQWKTQMYRAQAELEQLRGQLHQYQAEIEIAKSRIEAMETSKFWRLRAQWFQLKKILGLPIEH